MDLYGAECLKDGFHESAGNFKLLELEWLHIFLVLQGPPPPAPAYLGAHTTLKVRIHTCSRCLSISKGVG